MGLLDLDDPGAQDPGQAGGKAAWLARGRAAGLRVLPGVVIPAELSRSEMRRGSEAMERRGPGGALLTVSTAPMDLELEASIVAAATSLGDDLVVRSSSVLEAGGEWSGAFTSYLDIQPADVPRAVRGCWASAFTVHTLERYAAADIDPGSVPMAVLVQPALSPLFGGVARLADGEVNVIGVAGSPVALVQGWAPGSHAYVNRDGRIRGDSAISLMGEVVVGAVAEALRRAEACVGANSCEWAYADGEVWLLQLMYREPRAVVSVDVPEIFGSEQVTEIARLVRRYPGPLGETLVLPWAVSAPDEFLELPPAFDLDPVEALAEAIAQARALAAEVWHGRKGVAAEQASSTLKQLRGESPEMALGAFAQLRTADNQRANSVLALIRRALEGLVEVGAISNPEIGWHLTAEEALTALRAGQSEQIKSRIGFDRWEPFDAASVIARGNCVDGVPAAPGIAVGRMCFVADPYDVPHFRPRDIVVGTHPLPNLAALLWDASGLITTGGGPAAHLFESALALAIPAVCGLNIEELIGGDPADFSGTVSLAIDGNEGRVWATDW